MQYASFSFLDLPQTDTNNFVGGYMKISVDPPMKNCQLIFHAICQFQFFRPPPKTDTNNFLGGYKKIFLDPPPEKLLVDISYKIPVYWNWYIV